MKLIPTKEAFGRFKEGEDLWYCCDDFLSNEDEEIEDDCVYLEAESDSGVNLMSRIGMITEGDKKDAYVVGTDYFSDEEYYYYVHPVFKNRFLKLYDSDEWHRMADDSAKFSIDEKESIFIESTFPIKGMHQITCYSASMLKSVMSDIFEVKIDAPLKSFVLVYDKEVIAVVESISFNLGQKLMIQALEEHLNVELTDDPVSFRKPNLYEFVWTNEDGLKILDSFECFEVSKYN